MSEPTAQKTIKVKSPRMLADVIAWTQSDFYPEQKAPEPPAIATATARPSSETIDTVNFSKLDDDNIWTDV